MRILITHDRYPPDIRGGGEVVVAETARNLHKRGVDVQVLATGDPSLPSVNGMPVERLPIHPYRMNLAVKAITERARSVDLIQTFTYHAALPSYLAGRAVLERPVVCTVLGLFGSTWRQMRGPVLGRIFEQMERFVVTREYTRISFLSEYSRRLGLDLGVDAHRAIVNSPGIEQELYAPAQSKEDVVLYAGKLDQRKGLHDLLAAAGALPQVPFRLVGWGPGESMVRAQGLPNVELVPFVAGAALARHFSQASIFVFPSYAETFGIVLLEAMASGCAIVSSVPLDFAGEHHAPGDRESLITAIAELWSDRRRVREMGSENVQIAQRYTWDQYTDTLLESYRAVLRERR